MSEPMTIILAGGGTGGHLYPGVAVAQALKSVLPDAKCLFLCTTRSIDTTILQPTGFEFIPQSIVPPVKTISGLLKFWKTWRETRDQVRFLLKQRRPAVVCGLGGYAAGAAVKMAGGRGIASLLLNPDVIPGKANQFLFSSVRAICCQFPGTRGHIPALHQGKMRLTGCPIRADIAQLPPRAEAIERLGLDRKMRTLVITGASQGAATVNQAMLAAVGQLSLQGWQILHLAGQDHAATVRQGYREQQVEARIIDFTADMADVWACCDLAVSRAGAGSCAELAACGIASILLPYPYHKDMHQRANAQALAEAGGAVMVEDTKDARKTAAVLVPLLQELMVDSDRRLRLAQGAKSMGHPNAAAQVANIIAELASGR